MSAGVVLSIRLEDAATHSVRSFVLDRSPVRVGRSALNDLPLDYPFVSHCHAVIHFDEWGVRFVDLGSTNGTYIGASRMDANVAFQVVDGVPVRIGQLTMHIRTARPDSVGEAKATYSDLSRSFPTNTPSSPANAPPTPNVAPAHRESAPSWLDHARRACVAYRDQRRAMIDALANTLPRLAPHERDAWLHAITTEMPDLLDDAGFQRVTGRAPAPTLADDVGRDSSAIVAARLGLAPPPSPARFAETALDVLTRFAQAFVELRRGQQQFLNGFGLSNVDFNAPTVTGSEARQVLAYLLDADSTPERRSELNRAYADMMSHEVAVLGAVVAGVRDIVEHLRPASLAERGAVGAMLDRVFPGRRLRRLEARIDDLADSKTVTRLLFGRAFAEAYGAAHRAGEPPARRP